MPTAATQVVSVSTTTYPTDPQYSVGFEPDQFTFYNQSVTDGEDVYVSFDGVENHGILRGNTPLAALNWETKSRKVWFKQRTAGSAIAVDVMCGTRG